MKVYLYTLSRQLFLFLGIFIQKRISSTILAKWAEKRIQSQGGIGVKLNQFTAMKNQDPLASPLMGTAIQVEQRNPLKHIIHLDNSLSTQVVQVDSFGLQGSLSQVHRARLGNGKWVALKFCRPRIKEKIKADTLGLHHGLKAFHHFRKGFDSAGYSSFFTAELEDELDLKREARIQAALGKIIGPDPSICIPVVHEGLCSDRILVMDWEPSTPMAAAADLPAIDRDHLLQSLSFAILAAMGRGHLLIADLNPGNVGWRMPQGQTGKPTLVLYDFGSVIRLSPEQVQGFADLVNSLQDNGEVGPALQKLGFSWPDLEPIQDLLPGYLQLLFEPLLAKDPYDLSSWNRKPRAEQMMGESRWVFMSSAPPELFAFMRCMHGWFHWHQVLQRPFHARPLLNELLSNPGNADSLERGVPVDTIPSDMASVPTPNTRLNIHVTVGGESRVKLALPAACASDLKSLVDPDLLPQIESSGVDLNHLSQIAVNSGFARMDLFRQEYGQKVVHIFLA